MSRRIKRLLRRLREGKTDPKNVFDIRIRTCPMLSDEELAARNDKFPGDEFEWAAWTAKSVAGATETRNLLDSFHLVGRRIWNIWTTSHDYFNNKDGLEDAVCSDLADRLGWSEDRARSGSSIHALAKRAKIRRRMEIDRPFVLEFDSRETFEIDVEIAPTFRISTNRIPLRLLDGKFDNVNPMVMFSPVLGRTIASVDLRTVPEGGKDDTVDAILLRLDNGLVLEIRGFYDYLDVDLLARDGMPKVASILSLRQGFFNYEDLHFDPATGFESKDATISFGWKGKERIGRHAVTLTPVGSDGKDHPVRAAIVDRRDALGLVLGLCAKRPEALSTWGAFEIAAPEWNAVMETGREILDGSQLSDDESAFARLLFENPPPVNPRPGYRATAEDRMRMKRNRCRLSLAEIVRWTRKAIPANGGVRVEL